MQECCQRLIVLSYRHNYERKKEFLTLFVRVRGMKQFGATFPRQNSTQFQTRASIICGWGKNIEQWLSFSGWSLGWVAVPQVCSQLWEKKQVLCLLLYWSTTKKICACLLFLFCIVMDPNYFMSQNRPQRSPLPRVVHLHTSHASIWKHWMFQIKLITVKNL